MIMMKNDLNLSAADRYFYSEKLGVIFSPERTIFRVWQPFAESACLRLYKANSEPFCEIKMKQKKGVFECEKKGCCEGLFYTFVITRNGQTVETADPYACAVTPDGKFGIITDMEKNKPDDWGNDVQNPCISAGFPVIYELSVRDFSMDENANFTDKNRGKFLAFCEENVKNSHGETVGLEYIKSLGVTHIQLMPVFDFDFDGAEYNWGYNPRFYNAPCSWYAQENAVLELRQLVLAAHRKGIGVVMDVVYNHVFSAENSAFEKIFPGYYFRKDKNGNFSNGSGCGNEFSSERAMARKFIIDSLEFWAREYKLDGFRFDLMGLLDVKIMRKIEKRLRKINPDILLYGEGWAGGISALPEKRRAVMNNAARLPGYAFFNDRFRDAVKGSVFSAEDCGYVNGNADEWHLAGIAQTLTGDYSDNHSDNGGIQSARQSINYVECHDNLTLFDKLTASMDGADIEEIIAADKMSAALVMFSKGIAFIQAGQEFLRSKNGDANSYSSSDSVNCLKWDDVTNHREAVAYYKGLTALRRRFYGEFGECKVKQLEGGFLAEYSGGFLLIVNPSEKPIEYETEPSFKHEIYADKDSASKEPLYTSERLICMEYSILFARRITLK